MMNFISMLTYVIGGAVLASANVSVSNWQFWVLFACMVVSDICNYVRGLEDNY